MKYFKDDTVFYQNNLAKFVSYLTSDVAVIIVEMLPNFDDTTTIGSCHGCMIGDNDNKISCTCEDTEHILELLKENTNPTKIPLIVNVNMLFDKPIVILTHESELEKIKEVKHSIKKEINELTLLKKQLKQSTKDLSDSLSELEVRKNDYKQLEDEMTLGEFSERVGRQMAHMLYTENDSTRCIAGDDSRVFTFNGNNYEIKVNAFWDRSNHFDYQVTGLSIEYDKKCTVISF